MKMFMFFCFWMTTNLYADTYCRVEPVAANGDDYVSVDETTESACSKALQKCEAHYHNCVVLACGNFESKTLFDDPCDLQ